MMRRNDCLGGATQGTLASSFVLQSDLAGAAEHSVPIANVRVLATSVTLPVRVSIVEAQRGAVLFDAVFLARY
jgi:hypothetical protein